METGKRQKGRTRKSKSRIPEKKNRRERGNGQSSTTRQGRTREEKRRGEEKRRDENGSDNVGKEQKNRGKGGDGLLGQDRVGIGEEGEQKETQFHLLRHGGIDQKWRNDKRRMGTFSERDGRPKAECEKWEETFYREDGCSATEREEDDKERAAAKEAQSEKIYPGPAFKTGKRGGKWKQSDRV